MDIPATVPAINPLKVPRRPAAIAAVSPALFAPHAKAVERFFKIFTANVRNKLTGGAYYKAAWRFSERCEGGGLHELGDLRLNTGSGLDGILVGVSLFLLL